jgi:Tol biopolymer transport system component/DNA-binding winged helix-turn-helix (wHTH) protein
MASPVPAPPRLRFGAFEVDQASGRLFKGGTCIKLPPQPSKVLLLLLERSGEVVGRDEIQQRLWGDSTFVDFERGINFSINQIRGALCDNAQRPRYIETLPRVGYRFVAPVTSDGVADAAGAVAGSPRRVYPRPSELSGKESTAGVESEVESASDVGSRRGRMYVLLVVAAVVAVLTLAAWRRWRSSSALGLDNATITRLTENNAAGSIAISPDGTYVVYSAGRIDNESLRLHQVATHNDVQLVPPGPGFHGITVTPDGKSVYFVRSDQNDPYFKYLYAMPMLGGPDRKLISDVDSPVAFSPDGRQFAFEHCVQPRSDIELMIANADGTGDRPLATLHDASCFMYQPGLDWSPDGRTIAVVGQLAGRQASWVLYTVSAADGGVQRLYSSPDPIGRPAWAADGTALLVPHSDRNPQHLELWTISFPGGEARRFSHDLTDYGNDLGLTKDRRTLAATVVTIASDVWVVRASDPAKGEQISFGNSSVVEVAEAADGKLLTIGTDGVPRIMVADGTQRSKFTDLRNANWPTPCGRYVVFISNDTGTPALVRVNADGSQATTLAIGSLYAPACSRDGKSVFYITSNSPQKIWRVPLESGGPAEVAEAEGDAIGSFAVSPDGALLAYTYTQFGRVPSDGWHVAIMPASGGAPRRRLNLPGAVWDLEWSPDGRKFQYLLPDRGATNVWELPLAGGNPRQLTKFASGEIFHFRWSADHSRLFLTRGTVNADVVLLSGLR